MRCPACEADQAIVQDSRPTSSGGRLRRRKCMACGSRWSTAEEIVAGSLLQVAPRPAWWADARALAAAGLGPTEIGRQLGRNRHMVAYALSRKTRLAYRRATERYEKSPGVREALQVKQNAREAARSVRNRHQTQEHHQ